MLRLSSLPLPPLFPICHGHLLRLVYYTASCSPTALPPPVCNQFQATGWEKEDIDEDYTNNGDAEGVILIGRNYGA